MRIFLFVALSLAFIQTWAQNVRIVNGTEREVSRSEGIFDDVLDLDSNSFYVRRLSTVGSGFTHVIQKVSRESFNIGYTLVCAKVDPSGKVTRQTLLYNKGWFFKPLSRSIVNDREKSLTIQMVKGKIERYDKIFVE